MASKCIVCRLFVNMKSLVLTLLSLTVIAASEPEQAHDLAAAESISVQSPDLAEAESAKQRAPDQAAEASLVNHLNNYVGFEQNKYRPSYRLVSIEQIVKPIAPENLQVLVPQGHISIGNYHNRFLGNEIGYKNLADLGQGLQSLDYNIGALSQNLNYDRELQIVSNWRNRGYGWQQNLGYNRGYGLQLNQGRQNQPYLGVIGLQGNNRGNQAQEYDRWNQINQGNRWQQGLGNNRGNQQGNQWQLGQLQVGIGNNIGNQQNQGNQWQLGQLQVGIGNNVGNQQNQGIQWQGGQGNQGNNQGNQWQLRQVQLGLGNNIGNQQNQGNQWQVGLGNQGNNDWQNNLVNGRGYRVYE